MESTDVPSTNERLDPVNNASGRILQIPFMIPTSSGVATINLLQDMTKYQSHDNNTLMNSMYNRSRAPDDLQFLTHYTDNSTARRPLVIDKNVLYIFSYDVQHHFESLVEPAAFMFKCQDIVTSRVEDIPVDNYEIVDLAVEASQPLDEPHEIANLTLKPYKIFSEVTAKLPQAIFSLIHGSEDLMLTSLHDDYKVECTLDSASTSVLFKGDIMNLMKLENSLRQQIFGLSATSTTQTQTDTVKFKDSSIYCDILKPVFSKRGREVKSHSFGQNFIDDSMITGDQVADDEYNHVKRRKQKGLAAVTSSSKHEVEMSNGTHAMDERDNSGILKMEQIDSANANALNEPQKVDDMDDGKDVQYSISVNSFEPSVKSLEEETKTTFTPKKAKKDYESLTPFKFFCQLCSFKTKRESHYKSHMSIHEKNPDCSFYGCDHCSFVTLRLGHLRRHEAKHSAVQYQCQKCKYSTDSEKLLHRHMRQKHSSADKRQKMTFSCPKCTYTTKTQPLLIRHLNVHLNPRVDMEPELIQSYRCEHCDYVTIKKEHFCRHMLCHSEKRPYLCDLCGAAFKRQDTLRQHKVSHLDREVRNYQHVCPHCEKTFRSTAHLADHMTIHTHIRAYLCEICGAAFKTKSVQRNHVNTIHKNPRSHVCTHCGKRFNTKFALQRHVRSHDSDTNEIMTDTFAVNDLTEDETVTKQALSATNDESESSSNATAINNQAQIMLVTPDSTSYETGHSSQLIPHAFIHSSETNTALLYLLN